MEWGAKRKKDCLSENFLVVGKPAKDAKFWAGNPNFFLGGGS